MNERPIWDPQRTPQDYDRLMTRKTFEYLSNLKTQLEAELQELGRNTEGGHQRAQIHDAATLEGHKNSLRGRLQLIGNLAGINTIEPCSLIDKVHIGNTVRLWTDSQDEEEDFTIVGPDDVSSKLEDLASGTTLLSYKSPVGSVVLGLRSNDFAVATINKALIAVKIISIGPGDF